MQYAICSQIALVLGVLEPCCGHMRCLIPFSQAIFMYFSFLHSMSMQNSILSEPYLTCVCGNIPVKTSLIRPCISSLLHGLLPSSVDLGFDLLSDSFTEQSVCIDISFFHLSFSLFVRRRKRRSFHLHI